MNTQFSNIIGLKRKTYEGEKYSDWLQNFSQKSSVPEDSGTI